MDDSFCTISDVCICVASSHDHVSAPSKILDEKYFGDNSVFAQCLRSVR